jgi:hypothetical protein
MEAAACWIEDGSAVHFLPAMSSANRALTT